MQVHVCTQCVFLMPGEVRIRRWLRFPRNRSSRLFEVTMWAIGTELRSFTRAADGLNCCSIPPACLLFTYIYIYLHMFCMCLPQCACGGQWRICSLFLPLGLNSDCWVWRRRLILSHLLDLRSISDGFTVELTQNPGSKSELLFLASTVTYTQDLLLLLLTDDGDVKEN